LVVKGEDFGKTGISAAWVRAGVLSLGLPKEATPGSEGKISDTSAEVAAALAPVLRKLETEELPPAGRARRHRRGCKEMADQRNAQLARASAGLP